MNSSWYQMSLLCLQSGKFNEGFGLLKIILHKLCNRLQVF